MMNSNTRSRRNSNAQSSGEPIAIIGLGCRFPGGSDDWRSYWNMLEQGVDAISETPEDRWNLQKFYCPDAARPGKTQSKWGGYVDGIQQFDPQLFGISPREAASMDPQQRMLLEVAYRAMEDGGHPLARVAGKPVSVFVGISSFDYAVAGLSYQDRGVIDAYSNTGGSSSIAANRISYCFDLRGPSVAVDTACSSSLVAVHMACESLWRGDAEMALAGGVNALLMPDFYVAFSQLGVLSPDGRCKSFDSRANGYVRSEGAGMAMLKPLSAALRDKDPIYAVIRSTALNQDGRTPGMTVPSQEAQETLIRTACAKAQVSPTDIEYIEAHGTGTPVGDPIEAGAIGSVLGKGRSDDRRCHIGSVKTNIGHLEAGAGIASLIKVALSLHHRRIPAHLHFLKANPAIDFEALGLQIPAQSKDWESARSRLAGINGFGYGGANAHVILEQAPVATTMSMRPSPAKGEAGASMHAKSNRGDESGFSAPVLLPLSARSKPALTALATELADWIRQDGSDYHLAEVAGFLAHRRTHLDVRTTACAINADDMVAELRTLAASSPEEFAEDFGAARVAKGTAFVFSGQGPQWWAMGRGLLKYSPAFRSVIRRCDAEFSKYGDWSLTTELMRREAKSKMQQTSIAQPSIFAIQVALSAVWESWGVKPTAIVGHSVGEIAAAYLSGALSFEDACCVAFHRGRTMDLASSHGAMVAAGLSAEEVPGWLKGIEEDVSLAAINGPSSVTISGEADAIEQLALRLENEGVFCRRLAVEYAFHSPQMEPVRDELLRSLSEIHPQPTHTTLVSTVTGEEIDGVQLDAEYWWKNVRQSVRFSDAMTCLAEKGYAVAVEVGPHPVLAYSINECFAASGCSVRTVPSLNRQQDDLQVITKSLGSLYSLGFDIKWSGFYNKPSRRIPLPKYPFQLQQCWSESLESLTTRQADRVHPLLGESTEGALTQWHQRVDLKLQNYLTDHRVRGSVVYPAAAMIETAIAATTLCNESTGARLQRFRLHNPCVLSEEHPQWLQSTYNEERRQLDIAFRDCDSTQWQQLATVQISAHIATPSDIKTLDALSAARSRCSETYDGKRLYDYCNQMGLQYGKSFQGIATGVRCAGETIAEIDLSAIENVDASEYQFHPALLDSCFHAMIAADANFDHTLDGLYLPMEIREIQFFKRPSSRITAHARVLSKTKKLLTCDIDIYDDSGDLCVSIRRFQSSRLSGTHHQEQTEDLIYSYSWLPAELESTESIEPGSPSQWLILMDEGNVGKELVQRLVQRGDRVVEVYRHDSHVARTASSTFYQVDPERLDTFSDMLGSASEEFGGQIDGVIYLWGLDVPEPHQLTTESLDQSTHLTSLAPLHLVQAWEQLPGTTTASLAIVTTGAQSQDEDPELTSVAQGPLIGFGRVIVSEYAHFETKLVDLPSQPSASDFDNVVNELVAGDEEDEILLRDSQRAVRRFGPQADKQVSSEAAQTLPCQLHVGKSSGVEELHYRTKPVEGLSAEQVEIEVYASGLNFSDVMKALDLYPGLPDGPVELGAECSGRICRVGPDSKWAIGDEVIAVAPGSFGTHVTVNASLVARKPTNLTHEQAATIPIAFLTADYALNECARLQSGDSVLIHSASGGVGLAAMQIASLGGIKVYATAGTDEKRDHVRRQGASMVMDSRSLAFGDETLEATNGAGVDAVLNSLPGEAITKGLSVLKTGGRFLEIGKRDIYSDSPLGLYPFRNNLSMFAIDLDQLFKQRPQRMGKILEKLVPRFETGELQPLPTKAYDSNDTIAAYKFMQQGKHIGKVAVTYNQRPSDIRAGNYAPHQFNANGTYWVAGGLGGFGLEIAKWMVSQGARSLVLSGRSQTIRAEADAAILELEAQGANVTVVPADITQAAEVRRVLQQIDNELPTLAGVIHTAMVLEDKLLVDLDRDTLERVLRPKVLGGWNLHQQTLGRELECFIMFSSLSSVFGHAGQANYSAANALLDSLAYYRRAQGLPAVVMNWGHLGEVGYLAQREQLGQRLERQGVLSFSVKQATDCLEYALQTRAIQLSVLRIDWTVWRGLGITSRVSPRFAHLLRHQSDAGSCDTNELASADALRAVVGQQRSAMVDQLLRNKAGSLLGIPPDQIQADRALLEMGLDSLMAVEMRNWIESQMELNIPISALMRSDSLAELTLQICEIIGGDAESTQALPAIETDLEPVDNSSQEAEALLRELPNLGEDEVNELLSQMLKEQD